ncbi:tetratricopeptide repeat protein [Asticcacaulis solisilvae]|uniref:tetratricopeptide repeat protein n=1 Tax=Asticcacaulis solisilvae TaxID=1217274 RepID=UPI003FD7FECA
MRYRLIVSLTALSVLCANPAAAAGLFGKSEKPQDAAKAAQPAQSPQTQLPQAADADQLPEYHKATPVEIQAALRAEPLAQAAFFADQFDHDPTDAQMGIYLSNAQRAMGRNAEAADTAHTVLLFAPRNVDALLAAARAHIADNNAFYAVEPLKTVTELKPKDWQAWSLLGVAYQQVKRPDDAQAAWATALKLSPDNAAVLTNMAMAKVAGGDFAGAEPLLRTAVAQKDATLQIRQNLALVLGLQGKMAEAEKLLRQDLPPAQADANLAWLQQQTQGAKTPAASTAAPINRSWDSLKSAGS